MWQRAREHAELPTSSSAADPGGEEHKDHTRNIQGAHGADMEHTTNKEHKERRTGSTRNIQGAHGAHGADMENIRSILLTRNTRNAARSIHKDGVRRGFETNADCYSMTRGNLEIKNLGPGGEGWGPAFPFVSLYGAPVMKFLQDTRLHSTAPYPFITCTVYIDSVQTSFRVYLSCVRSSSRDPCYRARRGGVGDDGGIQPEHRRAQWRAAPAGNAKTHSTPPSRNDDGVEHK